MQGERRCAVLRLSAGVDRTALRSTVEPRVAWNDLPEPLKQAIEAGPVLSPACT